MNIGLTGGIACGKSTVSQMLVEKGAALVDADQIAREVVLPGHPVLEQIVERFGQAVLHEDGTLHRKALGKIVFQNEQARKELEAIMHPSIRSCMKERMRALEAENPDRLVVVDVPLLFESKLEAMFDRIMVVYVPQHVQLQRLMQRDRVGEKEALQKIDAQLPIEEKKKRADIVIDNAGTLEETSRQVAAFYHEIEPRI